MDESAETDPAVTVSPAQMLFILCWVVVRQYVFLYAQVSKSKMHLKLPVINVTPVNNRDGTIHLPPNSILSRYLGAEKICIVISFLKNFNSTIIEIQYCYV